MVQRRSVAWLRLIAALVATVGCLLTTAVVPAKKVAAQTPFLSTPYYGSEIRTRVFNPPTHDGTDWALDYESVLAAADGSVYRARWQNLDDHAEGYGLYVSINHTSAYSSYQTRYGHLSVIVVSEGEQGIQRGQIIGTSGNTGHSGLGYAAPGSTLYAPYVYKQYYNWHSFLSVQNAGSTSTNVTVAYYPEGGGAPQNQTQTIAAGASQVFDPNDVVGLPINSLYSAVISSSNGQPLAAVVTSKSLNAPYRRMDYNAASQGDSTLFFPVIFKNYYNFNTALQILNTSNSVARVHVDYYDESGQNVASEPSVGVPAHGSHTFNQGTSDLLPGGPPGLCIGERPRRHGCSMLPLPPA